MKRKVFIIAIVASLCLVFSATAYGATANYSFSAATSKSVKTANFTLTKGVVKISGNQTIKSLRNGEIPPIGTKIKYELVNAASKKSCGLVQIAGNSFINVKVGTATENGSYYLQITAAATSVTASGSGRVTQ